MREYKSFQAFWPYYLREHSNPQTRNLHYIGSTLAILVLLWAVISRNGWLFVLVPLAGYSFAWISHAFIERNKPATWTYPLWSLVGDYRMFWCFLTGKLESELDKAGVTTGRQADEAG